MTVGNAITPKDQDAFLKLPAGTFYKDNLGNIRRKGEKQ